MPKNKDQKQYYSILQWITEEGIVSEKAEAFDYYNRPFLLDILTDFTPQQVTMACAQVGKSVIYSLKTLFAVKHLGFQAAMIASSSLHAENLPIFSSPLSERIT